MPPLEKAPDNIARTAHTNTQGQKFIGGDYWRRSADPIVTHGEFSARFGTFWRYRDDGDYWQEATLAEIENNQLRNSHATA